MTAIYPVILAGGSGSRLWPLSRTNHPKQFLDPLEQGCSLLQSCIRRACQVSTVSPLIIANKEHRFLLSHQLELEALGNEHVLLESEAKNTACSVLLASLEVLSKDENGVLLILPSDQFIHDGTMFTEQLKKAAAELSNDEICLLAVKPTEPSSQYGYLQVSLNESGALSPLKRFIEKPDEAKAKELLQQEGCFWNAGIVLARASHIRALFQAIQPDLYDCVSLAFKSRTKLFDFTLVDLSLAASQSFDYAVLEHARNIKACILDTYWSDLGTWPSLLECRKKLNKPEMQFSQGKNKLIFTAQDIVVVDDDDLLFVADMDQLTDLSTITDYLAQHDQLELLKRIDVHRPWGSFKVLASGNGFLVKQLLVYANQQISLQSHKHRIENWVVVSGVASVQIDGQVIELNAGQSVSIKENQKHRLLNKGCDPLNIIEVQTGQYLDESDIIRYDDQYLRHLE
jgi:mannose-1-phosphate guanylyltransferase/mannose-6-phosphate isomerase